MKYLLTSLFLVILFLFRVSGQEQNKPGRQWEYSLGCFGVRPPSKSWWIYHLGAGVNLPGKKTGWYTNYALDFTYYGGFSSSGVSYYTLTAGKHYQWTNNRFYASLGFNGGLFFAHSINNKSYEWQHIGLAVHPRSEIGLSYDRFKFSLGFYLSIGGGYLHDPAYEDYYKKKNFPPSWFGLNGAMCPYLKIIL